MTNPFDLCSKSHHSDLSKVIPSRSAIYPSTAYVCQDPTQADSILAGTGEGYAYQRDGHPNADWLKQRCAELHQPQDQQPLAVSITSSGMAALTLAMVTYLESGDHVLLSNRLYGKSAGLIAGQLSRFGIRVSEVDVLDLPQLPNHFRPESRMLLIETVSNPQFRVADIERISAITRPRGIQLLVDNTFATPVVCRPLDCGADLVMESISKFMNGHGDLMLGMLATRESESRQPATGLSLDQVGSTWGLAASPFDCWLAERGLSTLAVRMAHASSTAFELATRLCEVPGIFNVRYPGLEQHPDHSLAKRQFLSFGNSTCFSNLLAFDLGDSSLAARFIRTVSIPFCPSFGETCTTLSHPGSTSHRTYRDQQLEALGFSRSTIRLSVGLESADLLLGSIQKALIGLDE